MKKFIVGFLTLVFVAFSGFWWPVSLNNPVVELQENWQDFKSELTIATLNPLHRKRVQWVDDKKNQTEIAFVYIHGFSASPQEISPVMELVAEKSKSNLYFARLTGHALGADAMGEITPEAMRMDAEEAYQIGKKIGKKVILVGCSTGAILALDVALRHPDVLAVVAISPNYRPVSKFAHFVGGPLGPLWTRVVFGEYRTWSARNKGIEENWTTRYRSRAVSAMMDYLSFMNGQDLTKVQAPVATLYTLADDVVDIPLALEKHKSFQNPKSKLIEVPSKDHVLAGQYQSPETTDFVVNTLLEYTNTL